MDFYNSLIALLLRCVALLRRIGDADRPLTERGVFLLARLDSPGCTSCNYCYFFLRRSSRTTMSFQ